MSELNVQNLKDGDYLVAEFAILDLVGGGDYARPEDSGLTKTLSGYLRERSTIVDRGPALYLIGQAGTIVQCVRQANGRPGSWLREITSVVPF